MFVCGSQHTRELVLRQAKAAAWCSMTLQPGFTVHVVQCNHELLVEPAGICLLQAPRALDMLEHVTASCIFKHNAQVHRGEEYLHRQGAGSP